MEEIGKKIENRENNNNNNNNNEIYDAVIVGGGPAGLTAAIYLARARYRVLLLEAESFGGQIKITAEIVNYPGIMSESGDKLGERMRAQAEAFGAKLLIGKVTGIDADGDIKTVRSSIGRFRTIGVIVACGAHPRVLGFRGEDKFRGRGVAYCATCDGEFFDGKDIYVIGGGFAAAEESLFLTRYAKSITMLVREDDFTCARSIADTVRANDRITVLTNTEIVELEGDSLPRAITYKNNKTGQITRHAAKDGDFIGVFVFVGYAPESGLLEGIAEIDEYGYVVTDQNGKTKTDGVYAAGDLCQKELRQVVTAVGDGAAASTALEKYIAKTRERLNLSDAAKQEIGDKASSPKKPKKPEIPEMFDAEMKKELSELFDGMKSNVQLELCLNGDERSAALCDYVEQLSALSDKLSTKKCTDNGRDKHLPCVRILRADGEFSGIAFHGIPSGHEFTPFVLAICAVGGRSTPIDEQTRERIGALPRLPDLKVLVTLSCSNCPETVRAAETLALVKGCRADVYDARLFPDLREKFNVMSVPCLVVGDGDQIIFGKHTLYELVAKLENLNK